MATRDGFGGAATARQITFTWMPTWNGCAGAKPASTSSPIMSCASRSPIRPTEDDGHESGVCIGSACLHVDCLESVNRLPPRRILHRVSAGGFLQAVSHELFHAVHLLAGVRRPVRDRKSVV